MKTVWQKIYSFFGFWTYQITETNGKCYTVIYWICFPNPLKFYRKFDIVKIYDPYRTGFYRGELLAREIYGK